MPGRPFSTKRLLPAVLAALLVSTFLPASSARWIGDWPRDRIQDVLHKTYLVDGLSRFSQWVRPAEPSHLVVPDDLATRYEEAMVYNAQLRTRVGELEKKVHLLSGTHDILTLSGYQRRPVRVVDVTLVGKEQAIVIAAGTAQGVATGQCVVAGQVLVGTVENVTPHTATVQFLTRDAAQLRVELVPAVPGPPQRRTEALVLYQRNPARFEVEIGRKRSVEVGDLARLVDPRFPDEAHGFVVGHVRAVGDDPSDPLMFRIVQIEPGSRVGVGQHVIVLVPLP